MTWMTEAFRRLTKTFQEAGVNSIAGKRVGGPGFKVPRRWLELTPPTPKIEDLTPQRMARASTQELSAACARLSSFLNTFEQEFKMRAPGSTRLSNLQAYNRARLLHEKFCGPPDDVEAMAEALPTVEEAEEAEAVYMSRGYQP